jgi:hypothetical protein
VHLSNNFLASLASLADILQLRNEGLVFVQFLILVQTHLDCSPPSIFPWTKRMLKMLKRQFTLLRLVLRVAFRSHESGRRKVHVATAPLQHYLHFGH